MAIFHKSNYGIFQNSFQADLDGFVATTASEVQTLNWGGDVHEDFAEFVAFDNYEAALKADRSLADFRN
jgi:hypothetical protein